LPRTAIAHDAGKFNPKNSDFGMVPFDQKQRLFEFIFNGCVGSNDPWSMYYIMIDCKNVLGVYSWAILSDSYIYVGFQRHTVSKKNLFFILLLNLTSAFWLWWDQTPF
jgi:hypothetical protein